MKLGEGCSLSGANTCILLMSPFGGYKRSGRENKNPQEFLQTSSVWIAEKKISVSNPFIISKSYFEKNYLMDPIIEINFAYI